ncbi:dihydrofolate reductase [Dyadobacter sp. LJ53]|uniref:dihydrofolate reductase n=1 Tax=Dyadobacter chenwenxiniae TaxID=2906456 RepID=UPI001F3276E1|nr:dihydrofolate reductase [Dyadobacter chenwenxiniae]MCF0053210.1 dihydrofolate reductase [Dyadobacter chenwenxiniae]
MATQTQLYIIAAMSENRVIGKNNSLPWHLPDEWAHFRRVTNGKAFLMGRKSFEAPDALHSTFKNVILSSSQPPSSAPDTMYVKDIPAALALLSGEDAVFILGGASVFLEMLPLARRLYLTIVHAQVEGDAFFPVVNQDDWELTSSEFHEKDEKHAYSFSMNVYERKGAD